MENIGKMSLLEMTETILEKMDSDEVNSINDTVESLSVAREIRDTFRSMVSNNEIYQKEDFLTLESVSSFEHFNQLKIPENVISILDVWYIDECNNHTRICLEYEDPSLFIEKSYNRYSSNDCKVSERVEQYGKKNSPCFPVGIDRRPSRYTSFDDNKHLFFDSVEKSQYDTLQGRHFLIRAIVSPEFILEDTFVPPLRVDDFPFLLNDAIDACFVHFKGVSNSKAQKRARDQKVYGQNNRDRVGYHTNGFNGPPYGRHARGRKIQNIPRG